MVNKKLPEGEAKLRAVARNQKWRDENPEEVKRLEKEYYQKNIDALKAYQKKNYGEKTDKKYVGMVQRGEPLPKNMRQVRRDEIMRLAALIEEQKQQIKEPEKTPVEGVKDEEQSRVGPVHSTDELRAMAAKNRMW